MKVKHQVSDLADGEGLILTLADRGILDDKGELFEDEDELENVLWAEDTKRSKARRAATKEAKPLWEEDGKRRTILDKYDEEEEEMARVNERGMFEEQRMARQEDARKRLAEAASTMAVGSIGDGPSDYMTTEEAAALFKPKRRKKERKLREKATAAVDDEAAAAEVLALLEAEAEEREAAAAGSSAGDLGTRRERAAVRERALRARAAVVEEKAARFAKAVEKANWASLALKAPPPATEEADDVDDEELHASLARARRLAVQQSAGKEKAALEQMAAEIGKRREEDESRSRLDRGDPDLKVEGAGELNFTEMGEFVRNVTMPDAEDAPAGGSGRGGPKDASYMDVDEGDGAKTEVLAAEPSGQHRRGGWRSVEPGGAKKSGTAAVSAGGGGEDEEEEPSGARDNVPIELMDVGITGERVVGRGLAAALSLLKDKGQLQAKVEWSGRTTDKKAVNLVGLNDVYAGGYGQDRLARSIEVALTQRDAYGRVMTPKERFRDQCYSFHGKGPSKNKIEKKMRKHMEEVATLKSATSEDPSAELARLRELQRKAGSAFIVLEGKGADDPRFHPDGAEASKHAGKRGASGLGGGFTPWTGDKKVEAMLEVRKPPSGKGGQASKAKRVGK